MNIKILVATHKEYDMPSEKCYLPIHVGKKGKESLGYIGDDTGTNISAKNPFYSELTGLYWGWKNLECDFLGLVHYRRHLSNKDRFFRVTHKRSECILEKEEILKLLKTTDIILPKKRNYYIETLYSHYSHTHSSDHLDITRDIIRQRYPEYLPSFDKVMKRKSGHMFNMFIMKKDLLNSYCEWMFSILEELEKRIELNSLSAFDARLLGRVSELLLDVWLDKEKLEYKEVPYIHMGKTNFMKKAWMFMMAKVANRKYEQSA